MKTLAAQLSTLTLRIRKRVQMTIASEMRHSSDYIRETLPWLQRESKLGRNQLTAYAFQLNYHTQSQILKYGHLKLHAL